MAFLPTLRLSAGCCCCCRRPCNETMVLNHPRLGTKAPLNGADDDIAARRFSAQRGLVSGLTLVSGQNRRRLSPRICTQFIAKIALVFLVHAIFQRLTTECAIARSAGSST